MNQGHTKWASIRILFVDDTGNRNVLVTDSAEQLQRLLTELNEIKQFLSSALEAVQLFT